MDKHQLIKLSKDRSARWGSGLFWVDGVNFVDQAIKKGWEIDTLVYLADKLDTEFKHSVIHAVPKEKRLLVGHAVYEKLAYKGDIQGIGAVVKIKSQKDKLLAGSGLVLENTQYAGNLGTIMRTALGFGVKNIYLVGKTVDPFSPEVVRASMGAIFGMNIVLIDDLNILSYSNNVALSLDTDSQLLTSNFQYPPSWNLWLGHEGRGLTPQAKAMCQTKLKIKISSDIDSLNIAEAVAIALYEFTADSSLSGG
ncbi:RNA methyltransferase [Candidatus Amesbacteria bacterium]|nr:RNA methyltransferase [Candidatus Amesbacteria bacterium]